MDPTSAQIDAAAQTASEVGQRIKAVRRAQRMTIESLAEASGLTKSFLSKVERGRSTASVAALLRVSEALGLPLSSLFENSSTRTVLRAANYPRVAFGGHQMTEYLLTPVAERRVQVMMSRIVPGGGSGDELYPLPGEVEFVFVLSGTIELNFSDELVRLDTGDAMTFDPALHRSFHVPESAPETTVLWMIYPALPHQVHRI